MAKDIVVPQLGESVTEATIAKWMKKVGDSVEVPAPGGARVYEIAAVRFA